LVGGGLGAGVGAGVGPGVGRGTTVTEISSLSITGEPSSSVPEAVTVLSKTSPGLPKTVSVNVQVYFPPGPGWMTIPTPQLPLPTNEPKVLVVRLVIVTGSVGLDKFSIMTV
jgi:hypothetical protein